MAKENVETTEEVVKETKATKAAAAKEEKNEVAVQEEKKNEVVTFAGIDLSEYGFSDDELEALTGMESLDSSEISIPYATLIAKATREHEIGDIVFPDGSIMKGAKGETIKGLSVLNVQPVRVYFPQPFSPKNTFICRSLDGKVGAPDGKYAGRECAACEFSKYPEGGGSSPCRDQRLLLCTKEDGSLFHLQVAGVGVRVWKDFMSGHAMKFLPKVRHILGALNIEIGVKMVDTDYGPFPAVEFQSIVTDPFHSQERIIENLTLLKTYKEFSKEHAASAADQTRVQMAVDEGPVASGENSEMF